MKQRLFYMPDELYFQAYATLKKMARFYESYYPCFSWNTFGELCNLFRLNPNEKINSFSKGMRRQAELVLCLSTRPEFLLLDESFDGLDPAKRILAKKLLLEYVAERGASVIISSHNLHELEDLCDHVGLLDGQKLLLDCSVDEISASRCKFRVAFDREMDRSDFSDFSLKRFTKDGRLITFTVQGDIREQEERLRAMNPILLESFHSHWKRFSWMRWREKSKITLIYSNKSCMKPEGRAVMERERRVLSPSASLIRRSLISGLPAVLPYLLSMLILFTGTTFQLVLTYDSKFAPYLQQNSSPTLRSIYRYVLFESDGLLPLQICVLLAPVVLGICLFRFMASKRTVNVYYSLGFSRQSLFWCRYMAGELLLLLSSLIPVAANVFLNLAYFGSSRGLWIAAGSVLAALVILSSLSFAVTALVFSCVGTIGEGAYILYFCFYRLPFCSLGQRG